MPHTHTHTHTHTRAGPLMVRGGHSKQANALCCISPFLLISLLLLVPVVCANATPFSIPLFSFPVHAASQHAWGHQLFHTHFHHTFVSCEVHSGQTTRTQGPLQGVGLVPLVRVGLKQTTTAHRGSRSLHDSVVVCTKPA